MNEENEENEEVEVEEKKKSKKQPKVVKWLGTWPANCDFCKADLNDQASSVDEHEKPNGFFVDGKTIKGPWALMCPTCFPAFGVGLGRGKGQKYSVPELRKIEG